MGDMVHSSGQDITWAQVQLELGSMLMSLAHVTSGVCVGTMEMKSEGHAKPAPPFPGPGKPGLCLPGQYTKRAGPCT